MKPSSVTEALALLEEYEGSAVVMAGGTDLLVKKKKGIPLPLCVVDLKGISGLNYLNCDEEKGLLVGALTTMEILKQSEIVRREYTALAEGAEVLASPTIRRAATIAGNICNAAPSADTSTPLIALGAAVKIVGPGTERLLPVEEMFLGPGATVLSASEIVAEIRVPKRVPHIASSYVKCVRRYGPDLAVVGIAASVTLEGGVMKNVRIAEGAVAPTAFRAKRAEQILEGKKPDSALIDAAADSAAAEADPITDSRATKEYRREMVRVLTGRVLETVLSRAEQP